MNGDWLALGAAAALALASARRGSVNGRNVEDALGEWAYHATTSARLPSIATHGLEPADPEASLDQPFGLYFSPLPRLALQWGDVLLRFPWPYEYEEDPYLGSLLIQDQVVPRAFYTEHAIAPEQVEMWVGGEWRPIEGGSVER